MSVDDPGFIRSVTLRRDEISDPGAYPFSLPAVRDLETLELDPRVTIFAGENGTGKSTLLEAIAMAAGLNPEGGSRHLRFANRPSESGLADHLRLTRGVKRPRTDFFLRAESLFNVATAIEQLPPDNRGDPLAPYGGISLHEQSHGESFLAVVLNRFGPEGLYFLDEPEAALSLQSSFALLRRMHDLVVEGSQFLLATHSPVLMAFPGARILWFDEEGVAPVTYEDTDHVRLMRAFMADTDRFLERLLGD